MVINLYVSCDFSINRDNDIIYHLIQWRKVVTKNNVRYDFIREGIPKKNYTSDYLIK